MSLITEINRTETEKNKTKQVATNIDNKLVELGGEQATDLADVPNKMEVMVKTQYKKYAVLKKSFNVFDNSDVQLYLGLSFVPKRILVSFKNKENQSRQDTYLDSDNKDGDRIRGLIEFHKRYSGWNTRLSLRLRDFNSEYLNMTIETYEGNPQNETFELEITCIG